MRVRPCEGSVRRGRMNKATQFIEAADLVRELADEHRDVADAYVTLCVHAGIAASDVICCARLGENAQGRITTRPSVCWRRRIRALRNSYGRCSS